MDTINISRVIWDKFKVTLPMFTFLIAALLMSFGAKAALIDFDEATDGNLSNSAGGTDDVFVIDTAGNNKWKGTGFLIFTPEGPIDFDLNRFSFTLAAGLEITGVSFQLSNAVIGSRSQLQHAIYAVYDGNPIIRVKAWESFYDTTGTAIGLPATPIIPAYPFDAGNYSFYSQFWGAVRVDSNWSWDLEIITSSASTVPEPGTLVLLGIGFAGIGYRRHRSKKTT